MNESIEPIASIFFIFSFHWLKYCLISFNDPFIKLCKSDFISAFSISQPKMWELSRIFPQPVGQSWGFPILTWSRFVGLCIWLWLRICLCFKSDHAYCSHAVLEIFRKFFLFICLISSMVRCIPMCCKDFSTSENQSPLTGCSCPNNDLQKRSLKISLFKNNFHSA